LESLGTMCQIPEIRVREKKSDLLPSSSFPTNRRRETRWPSHPCNEVL